MPDLLLQAPVPLPRPGQQRAWWRAPASGTALAAAALAAAQRIDGPLLLVARDNHAAHQLEADLRTLAGGDPALPVLALPRLGNPALRPLQPAPGHRQPAPGHAGTAARRSSAAWWWCRCDPDAAAGRRARTCWATASTCALGQRMDLDAEKRRLESAGYRNVPQVFDPGDFAVRGGLLDVYPMGADAPFRVELLDDEIDTHPRLRPGVAALAGEDRRVELLPGREVPLDDAARAARAGGAARTLRHRHAPQRAVPGPEGRAGAGRHRVLPAAVLRRRPRRCSTTSAPTRCRCSCDGALEAAEHVLDADRRALRAAPPRHRTAAAAAGRAVPVAGRAARTPEPRRAHRGLRRAASAPRRRPAAAGAAGAGAAADREGRSPRGRRCSDFLSHYPGRVLVAADSAGTPRGAAGGAAGGRVAARSAASSASTGASRATRTRRAFAIAVAPFDDGFALDAPAAGRPHRAPAVPRTRRAAAPAQARGPRARSDHPRPRRADRGRADRPRGPRRRPLPRAGGDGRRRHARRIPRHRIRQGRPAVRAGGAAGPASAAIPAPSPDTAPLHFARRRAVGEGQEEGRREGPRRRRRTAGDPGQAPGARRAWRIDVDRAMYEPFAATFPFEETPDQHAAIEAVLRDLASSQPMDRVVCGDVGFGKTEVAVRAAFAAASAGKQVAVLVPTTLLAEQHYRNFRDRFADWPLRVEVLSRFKTDEGNQGGTGEAGRGQDRRDRRHPPPAAAGREVQGPRPGHRRRGTALRRAPEGSAEEAARQRAPADADRHADPAHAEHGDGRPARPVDHRHAAGATAWRCRPSSRLGRRAAARGLPARAGARRPGVLPAQRRREHRPHAARAAGAGAGGAHRHRPRADARARAGAGDARLPQAALQRAAVHHHHRIRHRHPQRQHHHHQPRRQVRPGPAAPAARPRRAARTIAPMPTCVVPDGRSITADARKRLEAIASMDELGAGFTLATHDLEIRGAGELLGEDQSGQMAEVGFSLYTELLERAVRVDQAGQDARRGRHRPLRRRRGPARAGADPRRLPARRARAPDAVQAHQRRARRAMRCASCRWR